MKMIVAFDLHKAVFPDDYHRAYSLLGRLGFAHQVSTAEGLRELPDTTVIGDVQGSLEQVRDAIVAAFPDEGLTLKRLLVAGWTGDAAWLL